MTRNFGSPHSGNDHSSDRNKQSNSGQYDRFVGDLASGLGVHSANPGSGFGVVGHFNFHMNRRVDPTGIGTNAPVRGAVTKYTSGAEIIRMPSGSIVSIPPLEPRDFSQTHINKPLVLMLLVNFGIWGLLAFGFRVLFRF